MRQMNKFFSHIDEHCYSHVNKIRGINYTDTSSGFVHICTSTMPIFIMQNRVDFIWEHSTTGCRVSVHRRQSISRLKSFISKMIILDVNFTIDGKIGVFS